MADHNDEHQEKEGHCIADIIKASVLVWSATLLTVSYLNLVPSMKMDSTFIASLLTGSMASFGVNIKSGNGNGNGNGRKKPDVKTDSNVGIK
jgi:hypothetical protein|tara:strand:- start:231 stop:506 length:276 start_codon:yes stop_codon:yes gene_type:complete